MGDANLTQTEADALIAMEKHRVNDDRHGFPVLGERLILPLQSLDKREAFLLDIQRSRIDLAKATYQNRARQIVVLVRLDIAGAPHRNPDGEEVRCPHLHLYRQDFGDKFAVPAPALAFPQTEDLWITLDDFLRYCNITQPPRIEQGSF